MIRDWYDSPDEMEAQRCQQDADRLWVQHDVTEAMRRIYADCDDRQPCRFDDDFKLICRELEIDFNEVIK